MYSLEKDMLYTQLNFFFNDSSVLLVVQHYYLDFSQKYVLCTIACIV